MVASNEFFYFWKFFMFKYNLINFICYCTDWQHWKA